MLRWHYSKYGVRLHLKTLPSNLNMKKHSCPLVYHNTYQTASSLDIMQCSKDHTVINHQPRTRLCLPTVSNQPFAIHEETRVQTTQSSIQIIRRHQQLQAQLRRNLHIRHIGLVLVLLVVAEILAYFLQDHSAQCLEDAAARDGF